MWGRSEGVNTNLRKLVLTLCGCHIEFFKEFGAIPATLRLVLTQLSSGFQGVVLYFKCFMT